MFDIFSLKQWVKKHFALRDILIILALLVTYLATRLINLDNFPIFTDEGIYIHWSKVAWKDAAWRFISLTDGKQPLHTWGMIPFLKIFHSNLLLGGRMFSVLAGLVALKGIMLLSYYLFGKKASFFAGLFYIFTPMFMFYDRMALADSAVNAGFIWVLFGSILLVRFLRLDIALMYGITAGVALLTKSSSQLFLGLGALAPILTLHTKNKDHKKSLLNYYVLYFFAALIALVIYNVQRLSPYLHYVAEKNATFVMTLHEFKQAPFSLVFNNLPIIPFYVFSEMGYMLAIFGIIGLIWLYRKDQRLALYFTLWILISYGGIAFMAKVIFPRYLIFFASLLTVCATYLFSERKNERFINGLTALFLISVLYFDFTIMLAPARIPFPPVDRGQYIESFNAGWGIKDMIQYARQQSVVKPVILIGEGNFGVVSDMLDASLAMEDHITVKGYWPLNKADLMANQSELKDHFVYVVFSHREDFTTTADWPMVFIKKYPKPGGTSNYYLYQMVESATTAFGNDHFTQ
ncbi:glycosyltransferase family 39 protein [Candidatus Microgenomates bacterium]|nr:glycosyltransferase family 39 protein [Candidatus Microgenomates bacterium]